MEEFQMTPNSKVTLSVAISSAAIVGSNVSINDKMIKKSIAYKFTTELGNSNDLKNKIVTSFSNFSTHTRNSDLIVNSTIINYKINDKKNVKEFTGTLVKINENGFVIYVDIELI
jgi:hypothetical protein